MNSPKIAENFYWVGALDPDLRVFDVIMRTEFGTSYNSFLLTTPKFKVLFETAKVKFWDQYRDSLASLTDISRIDYLVVDHTEPDHAGSIEKLLELNPGIRIVGTASAITFLKFIVNREFQSITVKDNDTLSLGGKTLRFLQLPNLHWPDTMYTYVEEDGVLFTCDSFGAHYSHPGILRSTVTDTEGYLRAAKYYFDNILGPFKVPFLTKALDRVSPLRLNMICPGHGPVLDSHIPELLETYRAWCAPQPHARKQIVIPYVSAYGYTASLAEAIAAGIRASGDAEVQLFDMVTADAAQVQAALCACDGFLLGSPTILSEALPPIWGLLGAMCPVTAKGKFASAFGSYGWSGEAVPHLLERMRQLKLTLPEKYPDGLKVRFKPAADELTAAHDFGFDFGCMVLGKTANS